MSTKQRTKEVKFPPGHRARLNKEKTQDQQQTAPRYETADDGHQPCARRRINDWARRRGEHSERCPRGSWNSPQDCRQMWQGGEERKRRRRMPNEGRKICPEEGAAGCFFLAPRAVWTAIGPKKGRSHSRVRQDLSLQIPHQSRQTIRSTIECRRALQWRCFKRRESLDQQTDALAADHPLGP